MATVQSWEAVSGHPRRWAILGAMSLATLIVQIDQSGLILALPHLQHALEASTQQVQWVMDAYSLALAALVLSAGALSDRVGRRRVFLMGVAMFAAASIVGAVAGTVELVIGARAGMGIGAAMFMPGTLSILTQVFPESSRAKAIGIWGSVTSLGVILGPLAGGASLEAFGWRSIFWLNAAVAAIAFCAAALVVPESRDPHPRRLDLIAAALSALGLMGVTYAIITAGGDSLLSIKTLGGAGVGLVSFALLGWRSAHQDEAMFDMSVARTASFQGASIAAAGAMFVMTGLLFVITQHLQLVLNYSTLRAGVAILPLAAAVAVASSIAPALADRVGARVPMVFGMLTLAAAATFYALSHHHAEYGQVAISLVLVGLGLGLVIAPANDLLMRSGPPERSGLISSMNDTVQEVGTALGVAITGATLSHAYMAETRHEPSAIQRSLTNALGHVHARSALFEQALTAFSDATRDASLAIAGVAIVVAIAIAIRLRHHHDKPNGT